MCRSYGLVGASHDWPVQRWGSCGLHLRCAVGLHRVPNLNPNSDVSHVSLSASAPHVQLSTCSFVLQYLYPLDCHRIYPILLSPCELVHSLCDRARSGTSRTTLRMMFSHSRSRCLKVSRNIRLHLGPRRQTFSKVEGSARLRP